MVNYVVININIFSPFKDQTKVKSTYNAAGYYFKDNWRSLSGAAIQQFNNASAITNCLRGKIVYMHGDSTIRQWFEYLTAYVPSKSGFFSFFYQFLA